MVLNNNKDDLNFSIIIPTFNSSHKIIKTIESVANQIYQNYELIIVDDGSTDNTKLLLEQEVNEINYKYIYQENQRQGSARNNGLRLSTGDYVLYLDAGDYLNPNLLLELYKKIKSCDRPDVVFFNYTHVSEAGEFLKFSGYDESFFEQENYQKIDLYNLPKSPCFNCAKREFLIENKIFFLEKVFFEDIDYIVRVVSYANIVVSLNIIGYFYVMDDNSTIRGADSIRNLDVIASIDSILSLYYEGVIEEIDYVEFIAIKYLLIDAVIRSIASKSNEKEKKYVYEFIMNYMNENFPDYKENIFFKKLGFNKKIVFYLIIWKQTKILELILKIKGGI